MYSITRAAKALFPLPLCGIGMTTFEGHIRLVPMKLAGYSGTPLPKKLGIKSDGRSILVNAPQEIASELSLSRSASRSTRSASPSAKDLDFVLVFTKTEADLKKNFAKLAPKLQPAGMLWVGWPKKASGVPTDLTEDVVRKVGVAAGMVDVKVCAIDETWSGLKFVYRLKDRRR